MNTQRRFVTICAAVCLILAVGGVARFSGTSLADDTTEKSAGKKFLLYTVKPITNKRILPDSTTVPGKISDVLSIAATPGEYEPASFVLQAKENIEGLKLEVAELKTAGGEIIPSSNIDIKVVKCWYQDEGRGYLEETPAKTYNPLPFAHKKVLVPELLLNDDSLIKVDTEQKHNYLKTVHDGNVKHLLISSEKKGEGVAGAAAIPVDDAASLLPVDIKENTNKQFWVTIKVPEDASPGIYTSRIELKTKQESLGTMTLKLRVLPFKLSKADYISSMYYYLPNAKFYGDRGTEQFRKEMENMHDHGVVNPILPGPIDKLAEILEIRNEVGMNDKSIFYVGIHTSNSADPKRLESLKNKVKKAKEVAKDFGVEDVYVYGIDEGLSDKDRFERFTSQRPAWEAVHEAGGKVFVAGVKANHFKDERKPGNVGFMGDIQDMMVAYGYPTKEEAASWHGKDHKILCYANPQSGMEQPETYRKNFGLLLWQCDYDGAMTYIYRWEWGDFYRPRYKQHNMVYATIDGVIDTVQWEGYREGVDDARYLTTLIEMIKKAEKSDDQKIKTAASEAEDYLKKLKENDINKARTDMDVVRSEMIDHILKLGGY